MTRRARIGNFVLVRHGRRDEPECVRSDVDVGDGRLNLRHVARDALAPGRRFLVMRVLLDRRRARAVR